MPEKEVIRQQVLMLDARMPKPLAIKPRNPTTHSSKTVEAEAEEVDAVETEVAVATKAEVVAVVDIINRPMEAIKAEVEEVATTAEEASSKNSLKWRVWMPLILQKATPTLTEVITGAVEEDLSPAMRLQEEKVREATNEVDRDAAEATSEAARNRSALGVPTPITSLNGSTKNRRAEPLRE